MPDAGLSKEEGSCGTRRQGEDGQQGEPSAGRAWPWLLALGLCGALHASLSTAVPQAAWVTPTGVGSLCLVAMIFSLHEARCDRWDEYWRWHGFAAAFACWATAWGLLGYLDAVAGADFSFVQPDAIASSMRYIPLLWLMTPAGAVSRHRAFGMIDAAQCVLCALLVAALFFPFWFQRSGAPVDNALDGIYRGTLRYGVTVLAVVALFHRQASAGAHKVALLLALILFSYAIAAFATDILLIPQPGSPKGRLALMILDAPFALFVGTSVLLRHRPVPAVLLRPPFGREGLLLAPTGLTVLMLVLAAMIGHRNPLLGVWAGLATFALFAARVHLFQQLYVRGQAEIARRAQDRAAFLAGVSHDIRSPLTSVALSAAALSRLGDGSAERAGLERRVQNGCEHVIALLDDMLAPPRLEARSSSRAAKTFDAAVVIDEVTELARAQAIAAKLTLRCEGAGTLPEWPVRGDPGELRRALLNLVTNAIRFTPGGGRVTLTPRVYRRQAAARWLRITVTDDGIGMAPNRQRALAHGRCDPDRPVHGGGGAGLGLALARAAIATMGGTIAFESELGRGSRFWCDLPLAPPDREPDGDATASADGGRGEA